MHGTYFKMDLSFKRNKVTRSGESEKQEKNDEFKSMPGKFIDLTV